MQNNQPLTKILFPKIMIENSTVDVLKQFLEGEGKEGNANDKQCDFLK